MEIEYIYPDEKEPQNNIRQIRKQNTLGCLTSLLVLFVVMFVFLTLLPFMLAVLGWSILILGIYIVYKAYLEDYVFSLIDWLKSKR